MLQALDRNQNPFRLPSHEGGAWLMEVPYAEEVGSRGSRARGAARVPLLDRLQRRLRRALKQVVRATMDLLRVAGVSFTTLGPAEPCCGEPAKRLGEEGRFQMLAMTAIEMIKETRASKIITQCPHGLSVFLHEYPALGFSIPAVHHTELLAELVDRRPPRRDAGRRWAGPCTTNRVAWHGLVMPASAALTTDRRGGVFLAARSGLRTFCCGGGGREQLLPGRARRRISAIRYEELAATGADTIAVSCPFCLTMLRDAAVAYGEGAPDVMDVAEALHGRLRASPAG